MRFFVIRHGETDYNKNNIIMGQRIDAPLNENGKKQALSLVPDLKKHKFEMIYVSPMLRTKQTADIINKELNLKIESRDELKERGVGTLSGKPYEEVSKITGVDSYNSATYDYRKYGGESSEDVSRRVKKFVTYTKKIHEEHNDVGKELLVVTHSGIINLLYKYFGQSVVHDIHNVCVHEF